MSETQETGNKLHIRRFTGFREAVLLLIIIVAAACMSVASPDFRTPANLVAVLLGLSLESIVAVGMTILMVSGGFDLSVGSTMALSGAVSAMCLVSGVPVPLAVIIGLAAGMLIGVANGVIIAHVGINPFVTTLGMMSVVRGLLLVVTRGQNITGFPTSFNIIGQGIVSLTPTGAGLQMPIVLAIVMVIVGDVLLRRARFFRQNYYLGGNERAAILSGINVNRLKVFNYALTGLLAALAGIVMTARLGSASVTAGTGLELRVISAVIIGGASLSGGEGTVFGAFLGTLLMALIVDALTILGVDIYWNTLVIGATLLIAVTIDTVSKRRRG
jgi:ribose transport system permease protein